MGLFSLFKRSFSLKELGSFNKKVLMDCMDLVINSGIGDQYLEVFEAIRAGKVKKSQLKECQEFARWYKERMTARPELAKAVEGSDYKSILQALDDVDSFVKKKLGK